MTDQSIGAESLLIVDDDSWVLSVCKNALQGNPQRILKISSDINIRENWHRFREAPFVIIHWENHRRSSGALLEEILEKDDTLDPTNRLVVVTTNPLHEDVVYFGELGIWRLVRARNRQEDLKNAAAEIKQHIASIAKQTKDHESNWRQLQRRLDRLSQPVSTETEEFIRGRIEDLSNKNPNNAARQFEAMASLAFKSGRLEYASQLAIKALDANPNFFRAWNILVQAKSSAGKHDEAYAILQKMQLRNRNSVSRLCAIGHTLIALKDFQRAEKFFTSAIDRDKTHPSALNGLAEIRFFESDIESAKTLLAKSRNPHDLAINLNETGVRLVRDGKYKEALEHYTKAQYVLPEKSHGHQIYYNIALAYAKWGQIGTAQKFLKLSLVKKPDYKKAANLLARLQHTRQNGIQTSERS